MMRGLMVGTILGGVAMIAAAAPANATVTFGDAYGNGVVMGSSSSAQVSAIVASGTSDAESSQTPELRASTLPALPLEVNSSVTATQSQDGASAFASAHNSTMASFLSAARGSLSFAGGSSANADGVDGLALGSSSYYFQYHFSSDEAAAFSLTYALSGPTLGCCGNHVQLRDLTDPAAGTRFFRTLYGNDLTGTLDADLVAGDQYFLEVTKGEYYGADAPYVRGIGQQSFTHDDRFDFSITSAATDAVPEPASWALMIAGVGLVGGALRRRKPGVAVRFA